jgi:hypothetical protein
LPRQKSESDTTGSSRPIPDLQQHGTSLSRETECQDVANNGAVKRWFVVLKRDLYLRHIECSLAIWANPVSTIVTKWLKNDARMPSVLELDVNITVFGKVTTWLYISDSLDAPKQIYDSCKRDVDIFDFESEEPTIRF